MRDISIETEDIKNFFCKKYESNAIITKRILGITIKYVRNKAYQNFLGILQYIQPYYQENIESFIDDISKKAKKKYLSAKTYQNDLEKISEIFEKFDPACLSQCSGKFRKIQLKELEFVKEILNDIYSNTDLKPWMDDGTLLGAVRHKGFIPWDDDVDFSLMRKDYIKLEKYLRTKYISINTDDWTDKIYNDMLADVFKTYPNQIFVLKRPTSMKVYKGTIDSYVVCDFFALDCYNEKHNIITLTKYIKDIKINFPNKSKTKFKIIFDSYKDEINKNQNIVEDSNFIQPGIDNFDFWSYSRKWPLQKSDIFPLTKLKFEDTEFYAPCNYKIYLKSIYNFYEKLPIKNNIIRLHRDIDFDVTNNDKN